MMILTWTIFGTGDIECRDYSYYLKKYQEQAIGMADIKCKDYSYYLGKYQERTIGMVDTAS